ncbi:hypothetical protein [Actinomadura decatromicini]|uniref:hypothetical protein n=1 Tax=Actinomadura decatromicini TaxID=2604572 RepID=UPI001FE94D76|nr:hypothetical protein [Actinomadura decatromicini]
MTGDHESRSLAVTLKALASALIVGAAFGALTSLVNALATDNADLESRAATTSGWSPMEILTVLLDSGWAWAGLAVGTGWLVTRRRASLVHAAVAGAVALLAATAAYAIADTLPVDVPYP